MLDHERPILGNDILDCAQAPVKLRTAAMALPPDARQVCDLPAFEAFLFVGSSTRRGQRPLGLNGSGIGKSETCRASDWQSHSRDESST
jgi:hypothetical protein